MRAPDPFDDPVLAELAGVVAAVRPAPSADAARRIDARVAKRLRPRPPLRQRWSGALMPALGLATCVVLLVGIGVLARGGGQGTGTSTSSGSTAAAPQESSGSSASSAGSAAPAAGARAVEQTTTMTLATPPARVDRVASAASAVATDLGGYVSTPSVTNGEGADLELKVPGERLDQADLATAQLGKVRGLQRSTLDITSELSTARQQVADLRAERRSLLRRLAHAGHRRSPTTPARGSPSSPAGSTTPAVACAPCTRAPTSRASR